MTRKTSQNFKSTPNESNRHQVKLWRNVRFLFFFQTFPAVRTGFPVLLDFFPAGRADFLHGSAAVGTVGKARADRLLAFRAALGWRLCSRGPGTVGSNDEIDQQSDQVSEKDQQGPEHAVHTPALGIPVDPDNDNDPDNQKKKG